MQLNEILEENSIKGISQKTKISEENIENLLAANFDGPVDLLDLPLYEVASDGNPWDGPMPAMDISEEMGLLQDD